ncbi:hypothetical protein G4228_015807 [Cervus hanglu yarkandensis]|nr:hypothetical protein G4228_015807 [Cervus hanglu yarkandensis]
MASSGYSDLGEVTSEIKASERRTAVAIADLEWREMEGDDCEFHYGEGPNEAQDSDFPIDRKEHQPENHSESVIVSTVENSW